MRSSQQGNARNSLVGTSVGRYDIVAEIGTGGMASVYLARSRGSAGFRRLVAIKVMHPHLSQDDQFVEMFLDEARVAATIHHPNVVPIIDVGVDDGLTFLVMDYVEGDSLASVEKVAVSLRRRIPLGITLRVVLDSLSGLHAAHELRGLDGNHLKIIHRDVSPQNIVIGVDGTSRIVDFGIAKAESRSTQTKVGMIKGKLNFMAPEQLKAGALDRRVDVFGMGVTLWEAVTLRRLYAGENDFETARRILSGEYPPLVDFDPRLPPALDEVCRRALRPDPDERYASAEAFAEAIEDHLGQHIASHRDVAGFISGVAMPKLERERKAMRDSVATADDPDPLSSTVVESAPAIFSSSESAPVLPGTAAPRVMRDESSGTRKSSRLRPPTMAMPVAEQRPAQRPRQPTMAPAPAPSPRKAQPTPRPANRRATPDVPWSRPSQPQVQPVAHEAYDDDGSTALISRMGNPARHGYAEQGPPPSLRGATQTPTPFHDPPSPEERERTQAIDLVQKRPEAAEPDYDPMSSSATVAMPLEAAMAGVFPNPPPMAPPQYAPPQQHPLHAQQQPPPHVMQPYALGGPPAPALHAPPKPKSSMVVWVLLGVTALSLAAAATLLLGGR
ncbi:MAG: protein kinase [Polyangiales bacterium]